MDTFLDWNDGNQAMGASWGATSKPDADLLERALRLERRRQLLGRWPTNLGAVPDGSYPPSATIYPRRLSDRGAQALTTAPGGPHALDCPAVNGGIVENNCPGDVTASSDLSHFVFATEWNVFAPGGQLSPPGSVYDNNTATGTVAVASMTPSGEDIPSEPTDHAGDPLQIPGVSSDGSHILMAAGGTGPCGLPNCPEPPGGDFFGGAIRPPMQPSHLYMRVDGAVTYDVSQGHDVHYVGMTGDGSKVYFTSGPNSSPAKTTTPAPTSTCGRSRAERTRSP